MRQVPPNSYSYLIVGRGRMALNLSAYFKSLQIAYSQWHRDLGNETLKAFLEIHDRILLAIPDDAIEAFIQKYNLPKDKVIHFSGALVTPLAHKLHPLMTFTRRPLGIDQWKSVPFVGIQGEPTLKELIPQLQNPFWQISAEKSALYHSLCVLSGNGTSVLWQNAFESFEKNLGLPRSILHSYLKQICENLINEPTSSLTGPWVRNDQVTIQKNLAALEGQTLQDVYSTLKKSVLSGGSDEVCP
ncbi:MAG: DUF2520 domain-containing protein [Bdellovibrionales bacterium]|nr:DUF2520 domain-containing protein [Bdellovibrionales bacterium]